MSRTNSESLLIIDLLKVVESQLGVVFGFVDHDIREDFIKAIDGQISNIIEAKLPRWIPVEERLPGNNDCDSHGWLTCAVKVTESKWPTSSYDTVDSPYDILHTMFAQYDRRQKIWHLQCEIALNALIEPKNIINGMYVTHWMPIDDLQRVE